MLSLSFFNRCIYLDMAKSWYASSAFLYDYLVPDLIEKVVDIPVLGLIKFWLILPFTLLFAPIYIFFCFSNFDVVVEYVSSWLRVAYWLTVWNGVGIFAWEGALLPRIILNLSFLLLQLFREKWLAEDYELDGLITSMLFRKKSDPYSSFFTLSFNKWTLCSWIS